MGRSLIRRLLFGRTMEEQRRRFARELDGTPPTPEQLARLGVMVAGAISEIRAHCDDRDLVFALADAFHNLPWVMFAPHFSWSYLLIFLEGLERDYPDVGDGYLRAFDAIVGFRGESQDGNG